ncbi:VOC family protein [Myroides guanonis]|uniref:PhnB protein n=1 Tax=Myroides guanonis TaxID=1150112 RepID=A0A1I3KT31_9FLAO|nr:VOC family protein [Myroides guanonis]SFI75544.1 PhnB protein [Myroides guanonis]
MATISPYLNFNGNCEEAFLFYQSVFGGEFTFMGRFKDMPSEETLTEEQGNKIMHVSLPINGEIHLMGSDTMEKSETPVCSNISISINAASEEEAHNLFNGLSKGGKITMPLQKTFWGALFGMFTDTFGTNWMVNYDYEQKA